MGLKLYNTLGKKLQTFKPLKDKEVKMYTCGPTVYNFAHLGNLRAYITSDVLRRYLEYSGYKIKHVMNITDVDDKTIINSKKEGKTLKKFTEAYTKAFLEDMETLKIEKPDVLPKATEHIKEMVALIEKLLKKGMAYKAEDGSIYFDISKFKKYGKLSGVDLKELKSGARVCQDEYEKDSAKDFALWKAWDESDGDVFWETSIGKGRPGWHIECSAMSMKYLGDTFDIHTGGIDLVFPHHENEIAQGEAASGKKFVNYWIHNEWLLVEGKKMAKRHNNFFTLRDILAKGYSPKAIRYLLMSSQYRKQFNFTESGLKDAETTVSRLLEFMEKLDELKPSLVENKKLSKQVVTSKIKFEKAMNDDLNMPLALAAVHEFVTVVNSAIADKMIGKKNLKEIKNLMNDFDKVLGILEHKKAKVPSDIKSLAEERKKSRLMKDFKKSDEIREKIRKLGWEVQDTPEGQKLRKNIS